MIESCKDPGRISVMRPLLPKFNVAEKYLSRIDVSRIYSNNGPLVRELESRYSEFFGLSVGRVVAMSNATLALTAAMACAPEGNWLIPDYTFAATGLAAKWADKFIITADIELDSWLLSFSSTIPDDCGITPVMPFGAAVTRDLFRSSGTVVVDAAASLGAVSNDFSMMKDSDSVVFSLHATKVLGCGEGALVITGTTESADRLRMFANFGFDNNRISQISGSNLKMCEISAAYGLAALDEFDTEISDWRMRLDLIDKISYATKTNNVTNKYQGVRPYWIAQFATTEAKRIASEKLSQLNIESRAWWPMLVSQTPGILTARSLPSPNSQVVLETTLGLPLWRDLSTSIIERIGLVIGEVQR
jgi:dTDP-4-amino-4,6-dideoxygalactose transaminase